MNKQVLPIPLINHETEALKLSVAVELLYRRICTMQVQFQQDPSQLSPEDWEDYVECEKFLNTIGGKKMRSADEVQQYLDEYYANH
jgi:hypothetical protein